MENLDFLKTKYNLHVSPEAEKAAERAEKRTGEKIPQKPEARIQNYLDRFKEIIERKNPEKREHGLSALKRLLHSKFIIKPDQIPQSYYNLQGEIARELGRESELIDSGAEIEKTTELDGKGNEVEKRIYTFPEEIKKQLNTNAINNQQRSLNKWVDYLASPDAQYPDWAKYWVFRSILEIGKLEKKQDEQGREIARFQPREKNTVASFPILNPRALALTIGALGSRLEEKAKPKKERKPIGNKSVKLNEQEFQQLLSTEKFSKIYAQFLIEMPEYSTEGLQETRGKWVKYSKGSEAGELVKSLEGYPLEWCTADFDTAQTQLEGGNFYVYYSINEAGEAIIPRLAIRLEDDRIAEARGIAPDQNLDPYIVPVLEDKLKEFGSEGEAYKKKSADMKLLTEIENKVKVKQPLAKDELIFLYEINSPIEGFGYQEDPRIEEIRQTRNLKEDAPVVFECDTSEIAYKPEDVNENTKTYIGPLFKNVFQKNIKHIYTSFQESQIEQTEIKIGGMTEAKLELAIKNKKDEKGVNYQINSYAKAMMKNQDFIASVKTRLKNPETISLARLKVKELVFSESMANYKFEDTTDYEPTTYKLYKRAEELGLELCPPETGPHLCIKYEEVFQRPHSLYERLHVGMKPIDDYTGTPNIFTLARRDSLVQIDFLGLDKNYAGSEYKWSLDAEFVFRFRKPPHQS